MQEVKVNLGLKSYRIIIGYGIVHEFGMLCKECNLGEKVAIITNPTVAEYYLASLRVSLKKAGFNVFNIVIPDGEFYKNIQTLNLIYDQLIREGFNRESFLVALGGGVIGDITGFAASTYLRGVPFVQVPTTILAQVDSSVGGKTGINHDLGKNMIGTFYQPSFVLIDQETLKTLPEREYLSGLAEIVKYGITIDSEFFKVLESNVIKLINRDKEFLRNVIRLSCQMKADVVEKDEHEIGCRAVLNYGHTFAHAVEQLSGYSLYLHGEAVAIGIVHAARLSEKKGYATKDVTQRIIKLLSTLGLPIKLPDYTIEDYKNAVSRDKKARDTGINIVFNKGIGDYVIERISNIDYLLCDLP